MNSLKKLQNILAWKSYKTYCLKIEKKEQTYDGEKEIDWWNWQIYLLMIK